MFPLVLQKLIVSDTDTDATAPISTAKSNTKRKSNARTSSILDTDSERGNDTSNQSNENTDHESTTNSNSQNSGKVAKKSKDTSEGIADFLLYNSKHPWQLSHGSINPELLLFFKRAVLDKIIAFPGISEVRRV